jgi:hypothetical protein
MAYRNLPSIPTLLTCLVAWLTVLALMAWSEMPATGDLIAPAFFAFALGASLALLIREYGHQRGRLDEVAQVEAMLGHLPQ